MHQGSRWCWWWRWPQEIGEASNGILLMGMPSFQHTLSNEDMWDVTLLLKAANQPMFGGGEGDADEVGADRCQPPPPPLAWLK